MTEEPTERQKEVLEYLREGRSVKEVAEAMGITPNSVYNLVKKLKAKGFDLPVGRGRPETPQEFVPSPESGTWIVGGLREEIQRLEAERAATIQELDRALSAYRTALDALVGGEPKDDRLQR